MMNSYMKMVDTDSDHTNNKAKLPGGSSENNSGGSIDTPTNNNSRSLTVQKGK